ncbi:MAG: tetraacyldisaccharide 4'-kinase [Deltaproteobacteria bacterium]|nr:tetraacyldisaccharide 4'-kinase [Deltaproteobacteria bacterium]
MGGFLHRIDWSSIHREKSLKFYTPALAFFSLLYGFVQRLRYAAYGLGLLKKKRLPGFVVSVGNLTAGGTGKTPAVAALAKWALSEKIQGCIISRGYGGRYKSRVLAVSDGQRILADSRLAGDEPVLLARKVPGIPVILSGERYRAGMYAHEKFGSDFFIMDDGFQHMQLERDLNLVLMDAAHPFGNGHLLPWGPLREPLDQLARADAFILTRFKDDRDGRSLAFLKEHYPHIPVFCADHVPDKVVFPCLDQVFSPQMLNGKRVVAFAGIGDPGVFRETLMEMGAEVVDFCGFKDHYSYKKEDLSRLVRLKSQTDAQYILTTEKDWMRIAAIWPDCSEIAYLSIQFSFRPGQEEIFRIIDHAFRKK